MFLIVCGLVVSGLMFFALCIVSEVLLRDEVGQGDDDDMTGIGMGAAV